ncbi:MAG: zinc carboxypeptidase [Proteobacteria bacterium]|nr:zinc carboxypeptidase [Pseudomonadota bacterium]
MKTGRLLKSMMLFFASFKKNASKSLIPYFLLTACIISSCGDYAEYHNYDELGFELADLANLFPSVSRLSTIGHTHENRAIWALKISDNVETDEDEPVVYIDGGIHGNEWIAVEVALFTAKHLLENYESDNRIRNIVNGAEIWIVPMLNPDGHSALEIQSNPELASLQEIGRKNGLDNSEINPGVDLNRNYDSNWGNEDDGTSHTPSSAYYCGEFPFSEPEALAVKDFLDIHPPSASISYHCYGQYIAYAGGTDSNSIYLAENMASLITGVNGVNYDFKHTYKSGGEKEWIYDTFSIPAFVVELRPTAIPPGYMLPAEEIQATVNENLSGSLFLMEWAIDNY